jgi:hypothetical protein
LSLLLSVLYTSVYINGRLSMAQLLLGMDFRVEYGPTCASAAPLAASMDRDAWQHEAAF